MSTRKTRGKQFEDYLEGESALSRLYRESTREEPSPAVDEAVLAAARDAVARPRTTPRLRPMSRRWIVPLSLAATVLLSVSLVTLIPPESWRSPEPELPSPVDALEEKPGSRTLEDGKRGLATGSEPGVFSAKDAPWPPEQQIAPEASKGSLRRSPDTGEDIASDARSRQKRALPAEQRRLIDSAPSSGSLSAGRGGQGVDLEREEGSALDETAKQQTTTARRSAVSPRIDRDALPSEPTTEQSGVQRAPAVSGAPEKKSPTPTSVAAAGDMAETPLALETSRDEALDELEGLLEAMQSSQGAGDAADARARITALRATLVAIAAQWKSTRGDGVGAKRQTDDAAAGVRPWLRDIELLLDQGRSREAEWQMALFRSRFPEETLPLKLRRRFGP